MTIVTFYLSHRFVSLTLCPGKRKCFGSWATLADAESSYIPFILEFYLKNDMALGKIQIKIMKTLQISTKFYYRSVEIKLSAIMVLIIMNILN